MMENQSINSEKKAQSLQEYRQNTNQIENGDILNLWIKFEKTNNFRKSNEWDVGSIFMFKIDWIKMQV